MHKKKKQFIESTDQFYDTLLLYIEGGGRPFVKLNLFRWTQLRYCPTWEDIQKSF